MPPTETPTPTWTRYTTERRSGTDDTPRTIVELRQESGVTVRVELRDTLAGKHRFARLEFTAKSERIAQAATMHMIGTLYVVLAAPVGPPLQVDEPIGHVGGTWFVIEGADTLRALHYLFGDQFSEAVL